ncbi:NUDIX hydrolase [Hoyosella subflava]|uniref:MutT/NUDIX family protein n=1 Tax=Hoyosella subflava (strain DSM 45089 / JCM 17490 / NBRC 109087 / DQS3-9A1) TaxID=443218 RepID=F6EIR5_HOYSD|nr:NUDIX hydrolase [Hoyosella subflava]AEF38990.1 MutT/NUDIX family protein [Hoyosella subflava DQS3-9A1]
MRGDGDGWVIGGDGARRWGKHGAAGLLLRAPGEGGTSVVLLQHRAEWSHQGGTWALPGGARDSHESEVHAALREAQEEAGIAADRIRVRAVVTTAGELPGWTYTTVVADAEETLETVPNHESLDLEWVREGEVTEYPLHTGLAASWPALTARPLRLIVDTANVVGSRANGWWRDRVGATRALAEEIVSTLPRTVALPDGGYGWLTELDLVLEGAARAIERLPLSRLHHASGSGDDEIVRLCSVADHASQSAVHTVVVTADRGLRDRLPTGVSILGPSALLSWLDSAGEVAARANR